MDRYLFGSVSRSEIEILEMEIRKSGENRPLDIASEGRPQDEERLTPPTMTEDNEILESGAKIAKLATTLAGTSIMALAVAFFGSQNAIPYHKPERFFHLLFLVKLASKLSYRKSGDRGNIFRGLEFEWPAFFIPCAIFKGMDNLLWATRSKAEDFLPPNVAIHAT